MRALTIFLTICSLGIILAGDICSSYAEEVSLNGQKFTVPDGFEITLIAGPPLIERPISADFDELGRLYVTESSGSNDPVEVQVRERPHRIVRLEDENHDGIFDKRVVFADKLMFPEGALWYEGSLYVAAPPEIWKFTDDDDDGISDRREVWFDGKTLTHCANDLHGPYLGPDGWFYWCKGASAKQTYERPGRTPLVTSSSHIFRRRPDGGPVEVVMTGGMANPVDVVFTPGGEPIFSTTFVTRPQAGLRDGLVHAIHGGVYGQDRPHLNDHPRTGPVLPILDHLGAAAPCGLVRLQSRQLFPDTDETTLLTCLFNMQKVTRHLLRLDGATFASETTDFLVSENRDFHPTDVLEDADGSVIVVDTGGWYKLCCPTSQLWKPDVLGAIYRVRRASSHNVNDPRGITIDWPSKTIPDLCQFLADARPAVRQQASRSLVIRGDETVGAVQDFLHSNVESLFHVEAVWTLSRISSSLAQAAIRGALGSDDAVVRQAALNSISSHRDPMAVPMLVDMLKSASLHDKRGAAEALGRTGTSEQVSVLLDAIQGVEKRELEHALIYAAIEIADEAALRKELQTSDPNVQRGALVALDQMENSKLKSDEVLKRIRSQDERLRETAWWIVEQHPEWWDELDEELRRRIQERDLQKLDDFVAKFGAEQTVQCVLGETLSDQKLSQKVQQAILLAMTQAPIDKIPIAWEKGLLTVLDSGNPKLVSAALQILILEKKPSPSQELADRLELVADDKALSILSRLQALKLLSNCGDYFKDSSVELVCDHLISSEPVALRALAVDILQQAKLSITQQVQVANQISHVGPVELKRLIEVLAKSGSEDVGQTLVDSLANCPSATALQPDQLRIQLLKFGVSVQRKGDPIIAAIERENAEIFNKMTAVLESLRTADIRNGQAIFHGTKAACSSCHAAGYLGGNIGPGLMRIGKIRTERDLLEAILFPSASFVQSFEPVLIATIDGHIYNGIVKEETGEKIVLQLDAQKNVTIPVNEIDVREEGKVSIMPAGLDKQFTVKELADLVAFLKSAN